MYSDGSTNNKPFLSSAVHSCNPGYTLTGGTFSVGTTRVCVSGGNWDGSAPTCQRKLNWSCTVECVFTISGNCSDLPPLMNGGITYTDGLVDSRPINSIATFTCDNGYTLTGGSFRQCQNAGTWSATAPTCQGEFHYILTVASSFLIQWTQDPLNHPPPVLTWLYQPMEWSATIWGLLVWDQWTLWPLTPVTLATLSMESAPGLVGVMECGVGPIQLVQVRSTCGVGQLSLVNVSAMTLILCADNYTAPLLLYFSGRFHHYRSSHCK